MSYAPEMERVNGIAPLSRPWHGRILLLNHTRDGIPSRTLTGNLALRTRPLCFLSYGDSRSKPLAGLFHRLNHLSRRPLELLRVQGF